MRLWWCLAESACAGSLESGGHFCDGAFRRNLVQSLWRFFNLHYHIKTFYKFCTLIVICKDSVINCVTVQHHTTLVTTTIIDTLVNRPRSAMKVNTSILFY
jgi:hypothetical protein